MAKVPRISDAEWEVMKQFWTDGPLTANQVVESLSGRTRWHHKTIRTLITRLVAKKALGYRRQGREYLYYPLVGRDICAREESRSLLRRAFDGAIRPMVAALIESEDLSAEDVRQLKQMLDGKRE